MAVHEPTGLLSLHCARSGGEGIGAPIMLQHVQEQYETSRIAVDIVLAA